MAGRTSDIVELGDRSQVTGEGTLGLPSMLGERLLPLPIAMRLFALLFGLGASTGMAVWCWGSDALRSYAVDNELPIADRRTLILCLLVGGLCSALAGLVFLARAKHKPAQRLTAWAWRLSPLLLIGMLPVLFNWQIWAARELTFGVLTCILGFLLHTLLARSAELGAWGPDDAWAPLQRWLSRLAARTEAWAPPLIVVVATSGYAAYFSYYTIAFHHSVLTMSYDLGLENNLLWNVVHGNQFMKSSPLVGPTGTHFGFHATLFAYVIGIFYILHQQPETLLVLQAVLIGAAGIPLYLFARSRVGRWAASLLTVLYVLYPPVHGSNLYDFHYLPLGVFFLWLTLWLVDAGHYKLGALAVLLTLSVREDVAADLAVVGGFMLFASRRPRAGLIVAIVAGTYFLIMKMVVMPRFMQGSESFIHQWKELVPAGGHGYAGVLMTVLANPVFTLTSLLESDKFLYLVQIGAPFCFLVWKKPIGYLVSLPGFFFTLLSTKYPPLVQISFQYTAHWTAFLFPAFVAMLEQLRLPKFAGDTSGWQRQRVWLATACFTTLLTSYQYGAILQQHTAKGGFGPYKFVTTDADRARYAALKQLIALVPPNAKIAASEYVVPHVSSRADAYTLRSGLYDARYILFELPARDDERGFVRDALRDESFGIVSSSAPFALAKRGYSTALNHAVLKQIR